MPVVPHSYVIQPPGDTVICRFMDFDKFRDLFANDELYLRRTEHGPDRLRRRFGTCFLDMRRARQPS
jgi:hypothetical protein